MRFSVVIPIYNEAEILEEAVERLRTSLLSAFPDDPFEILLVENGSTDGTDTLADALGERLPGVRALHCPVPDYGHALRMGIAEARGEYVVGEEIDLCDISFYERAFALLDNHPVDMVIGSKALPGSGDERPLIRRAATRTINLLLRWILGFQGTDTHGLKVFRREALLPVAEACVIGRDLFASEFVIRAERADLAIVEVPISLREKRPPAINLFRRVPQVLRGLVTLRRTLGPSPKR